MRQLMNEGEGPGGPRILIVDHHEGRNAIRDREAPEHLDAESGVVRAEVADEKYEHANGLRALTQGHEKVVCIAAPLLAPSMIESERGCDGRGHGSRPVIDGRGANERKLGGLLLVLAQAPDHLLSRADVAEERVQERTFAS